MFHYFYLHFYKIKMLWRKYFTAKTHVHFGNTQAVEQSGSEPIAIVFFFNYPLLSVFNQGGSMFGMPPLYAWLMGSWLVLIVLLALVIERKHD